MLPPALPDHDLDAIAGFAWAELVNAATDRDSLFRHAQLATIGAQGWPQSRTVILRHGDAERREVGFHTDRRSAKLAEMVADTSVALTAYDRARGLQVRLWGQANPHMGDTPAEAAWATLHPPLRTPYRAQHPPGTPLDAPEVADAIRTPDSPDNPVSPDNGFENFAFVVIRVVRLEWLLLRPTGHRRAASSGPPIGKGAGWRRKGQAGRYTESRQCPEPEVFRIIEFCLNRVRRILPWPGLRRL